jgi:hypothetical protein
MVLSEKRVLPPSAGESSPEGGQRGLLYALLRWQQEPR